MTTATSISSIGHLCSHLQRSYTAVRLAIAELGIKPAVTINDVDHFSDADVDRLAAHFAADSQAKPKRKGS